MAEPLVIRHDYAVGPRCTCSTTVRFSHKEIQRHLRYVFYVRFLISPNAPGGVDWALRVVGSEDVAELRQ